MAHTQKTYSGGTLRSLLFQYSRDRSDNDPQFKFEFYAAQAKERQLREAKDRARELAQATLAAKRAESA